MKIKYLLLVLLLFIPMVMGYSYTVEIPAGETYRVIELPGCVGDYQMKIRGVNNFIQDEFWFPGCYLGEEFYECNCAKTNNSVWIYTKPEAVNEYDIVIQYYISNIKSQPNERVINIIDSTVGPVKKKLTDVFPKFNSFIVYLALIIIIVLGLIILGLIMIWKMVMDSEENSIDQFTPVEHDKVVTQSKKIINDNTFKKQDNEESDEIHDELQNILDDLDLD